MALICPLPAQPNPLPPAKVSSAAGNFSHKVIPGVSGIAGSPTLHDRLAGGLTAGLTGTASALASAATRSIIEGSNFGDNVVAAIPDVVGQALKGAASACFTAGTLVQTPFGARPIGDLKVGDWVFARDEDFASPTVHRKQIEELYRYEDRATLDVTVTARSGAQSTIRTTPEHPFAIDGAGWVPAGDLAVGMKTIDMDGDLRP